MTDAQKLKVAGKALEYVLCRIRDDEKIRYLMGDGTQAYSEVAAAYSVLSGLPLAQVRNETIPGSEFTPHVTAENMLEEMEN